MWSIENIWEYTLSATIYGSITGITILIIKTLMKNKINKKYAYLLWMILIIKLAIPFGPKSNFSLFNQIPVKFNNQLNMKSNNNSNMSEDTNYTVDTDYRSNISENIKQESGIGQSHTSINNKGEKSIVNHVIPFVWISGVVFTFIAYISIYLHFVINIRKREDIKYNYLENILNECKEKLHIKRKISIVVDEMINSPSLIGVLKVRIIIPSNLINLSKEELEHIFLHELCHFKNRDTWVDNMIALLQCIHWFNPIVCYLFKQVRNDMEMACDERVLSILSEKEHNKYGLTMLTVLEKVNYNKKFTVGLNMTDDKKIIKKRVELIKNSKHFYKKKKIFTITGIICLIVMAGVLLTNGNSINKDAKTLFMPIEKSNTEDLDEAISKAIVDNYIKDWYGVDFSGEFNGESHVILGKNEDDDSVEVYLMATYGSYNFENDVFSMSAGSSNVPIKIKFSKVKDGEFLTTKAGYYYLESEQAEDGSMYKDSVLKMFPKKEANKALNIDYTDELLKDINKKAENYVKSIGRKCKVTSDYVEHEYIESLALVDKEDKEELWDYPDWIGTREQIENGKRYIYETQYDKYSNIVTFIKYNEEKEQLENMKYKINGNNLEKIDSENYIAYFDNNAPTFIDNKDFKMIVKNISIIDNNAEYGLLIENKTNKSIEINLDKIHIGESLKNVEFNVKLKGKERKYANLKIKSISNLNDLYDKIYGVFIGNSSKYDFIFK